MLEVEVEVEIDSEAEASVVPEVEVVDVEQQPLEESPRQHCMEEVAVEEQVADLSNSWASR